MKIGGFLKFSMIDYPGKVSAVVFTQGCNINCKYCHNKELIPTQSLLMPYEQADIMDFFKKRKRVLDGVVISGGEPTIQPDLIDFATKLKEMGYLVKLDTNGTNPVVLEQLIKLQLVDFVAMDIKATYDKYAAVCGPVDIEKVKRSVEILSLSNIDHEFRTTFDKSVLTEQDIINIKLMLPVPLKVQDCIPVEEEKPALKIER